MKRFIILMGLLIFTFTTLVLAEGLNTTLEFARGNAAYKGGDYPKAIDTYEGILKAGLENGDLYYNLGNSYFKLNHLGKAILNYERARQLMPRDSNLLFNYQYAISLVKNHGEGGSFGFFERQIVQYRDHWTTNEITWIIFMVLFLVMGFYWLAFFQKWPGMRRMIVFMGLGSILIFHGWVLANKLEKESSDAVIIQETESKYEPNERGTVYFQLPEGSKVTILKESESWLKVKRIDGKIGWIKSETAEKI